MPISSIKHLDFWNLEMQELATQSSDPKKVVYQDEQHLTKAPLKLCSPNSLQLVETSNGF